MTVLFALAAIVATPSEGPANLVLVWPGQPPVVVHYQSLARCELGAADFNEVIRRKGEANPPPSGAIRIGAPASAFCIRG